ncbi:hypothetical protein [Vibrio phage VP16C]|nr:hypothetical protein [Vibrio phage VP16C]
MTLAFSQNVRNQRLAVVAAAADAGSGPALIRIYNGTRPPTGGPVTTLLAQLEMSDPAFDAPANGTMTARAITPEGSTPIGGTATWFRITDSEGNFVLDGDVGLDGSNAELELGDVNFLSNQEVRIATMTINDGNE